MLFRRFFFEGDIELNTFRELKKKRPSSPYSLNKSPIRLFNESRYLKKFVTTAIICRISKKLTQNPCYRYNEI